MANLEFNVDFRTAWPRFLKFEYTRINIQYNRIDHRCAFQTLNSIKSKFIEIIHFHQMIQNFQLRHRPTTVSCSYRCMCTFGIFSKCDALFVCLFVVHVYREFSEIEFRIAYDSMSLYNVQLYFTLFTSQKPHYNTNWFSICICHRLHFFLSLFS